jgi:hypothetical protein
MLWKKRLTKKLYTLNVPQSFIIVLFFSIPLVVTLGRSSMDYQLAKTLAHYAILFFLAAFILYIFLFGIIHFPNHDKRKSLVVFTRIYIRFHVALAIMGTLFISLHITWMSILIPLVSPKGLTGILALSGLLAVLVTGYLRKRKSSGRRRRYHRYMAFIFIAFVIIHLIV